MLIRNIRAGHRDDEYRVEADVTLENRSGGETLFFAVPSDQAHWIAPEPAIRRHDLASLIRKKLWLFHTEHALGLNHLRPVAKRLLGRA